MMDDWRLDPLVARAVAWHNRHPLARRITPQQVRSLGFVALPFAVSVAIDPAGAADALAPAATAPAEAGASGSLRERAMARAQQPAARPDGAADSLVPDATPPPQVRSALTAAFSEDFIAPIAPARVARWAARHARQSATAPSNGPLRQVTVDDARVPFGHRVVMRYAMTAAIEIGGHRTRLLLGLDARAAVLGCRLWSRPRVAAASGGLMAVLSLAVGTLMSALPGEIPARALAAAPAPAAASAASAATGEGSLAARVGDDPLAARAGEATLVVPAGDAAPPATPAAWPSTPGQAAAETPLQVEAPIDVEPRLGRIELPPPVPAIDDAVRAAARQARAAAVPKDGYWAVTTRPLRTRAESLQWLQAVDELLRPQGSQPLQVEMLPEGDDWRVVGWPFARRADAERARAMLLARGLKVEVVEF